MIKRKSEMSEEEVLFEFSQEPTKHVRILEKYINQYPEYREALVTLSVDLFVNPVDSFTLDQASESSKGTEKAWSQLQSLLSPSDPAFIKTPSEDNPLARLDQRKFIEMAKSLDVSRAFLSRFRDSGVVVKTIPVAFIQNMADYLSIEFDKLLSLLESSPSIDAGVSFKSKEKPVADQKVSFDTAVENSGLSETQKEKLNTMKD